MPDDATAPHGEFGPLWVSGEFWLRVCDSSGERIVHVRRPFGLLGRLDGADIQIDDRAVSARHVLFHVDSRGLFAMDLSSRTGTRFAVPGVPAAWLDPGDEIEVAGRVIRFLDYRVHQDRDRPEAPRHRTDLLSAEDANLARVTLHALPAREPARTLDSELVVLGRGATCGLRIEGASASRVHSAILRTRSAAYVVDLLGRGTWLNDRPVFGAAPLTDRDVLGIGVARFQVGVTPIVDLGITSRAVAPAMTPGAELVLAMVGNHSPPASMNANHVTDLPATANADPLNSTALVGLMMRLIHAGQNETIRRQDEFQMNLVRMLHQMQLDNANLLSEHLKRIESINQELVRLKEEIAARFRSQPAHGHSGRNGTALPPPDVPPLRIKPSTTPTAPPEAATSWLLERVSQLEEQNRSSWRDLLGRLSGAART